MNGLQQKQQEKGDSGIQTCQTEANGALLRRFGFGAFCAVFGCGVIFWAEMRVTWGVRLETDRIWLMKLVLAKGFHACGLRAVVSLRRCVMIGQLEAHEMGRAVIC